MFSAQLNALQRSRPTWLRMSHDAAMLSQDFRTLTGCQLCCRAHPGSYTSPHYGCHGPHNAAAHTLRSAELSHLHLRLQITIIRHYWLISLFFSWFNLLLYRMTKKIWKTLITISQSLKWCLQVAWTVKYPKSLRLQSWMTKKSCKSFSIHFLLID